MLLTLNIIIGKVHTMAILRAFTLFLLSILLVIPILGQDITTPEPVIETQGDTVIIDGEQLAAGLINIADDAATGFSRVFNDFINQIYTIPRNDIVRVLMVIGGAILLVFGWRVYDWIIVIAGFVIGASTATALVPDTNLVLSIAALLIGGLVGALLGYFAYYVAVFFIGAYIGILLLGAIATSLGWTPVNLIVLGVAALLGGLLMLALSFELLVLLAALVGALLIVIALGLQPQGFWILGLTLLGIFVQAYATRRFGYNLRRRPMRRIFT
jgi:hypothetical protein